MREVATQDRKRVLIRRGGIESRKDVIRSDRYG
jgi:hypothetical protein